MTYFILFWLPRQLLDLEIYHWELLIVQVQSFLIYSITETKMY